MTGTPIKFLLRRHVREETGASLIEYTIVVVLFLLVFFALLDFGRLGFNWVMTEKAMQRAARIATVRPPVCEGVPELHERGAGEDRFGSLCRVNSNCLDEGRQACVLSTVDTDTEDESYCETPLGAPATEGERTAQEIWCILRPILPRLATPQNIWVAYEFDPQLGFLGGPYTPMVEVGVVTDLQVNGGVVDGENIPAIENAEQLWFEFITPIPALAALAGGAANIDEDSGNQVDLPGIPFPDLSVSMPGEDLNQGTEG